MRNRLEEKNRLIEKKTQGVLQQQQERNRTVTELSEMKEHMDIKDRKINVLQRKIENLEDLLKEKDNQVDMARARLTAMQAHHCSSEGALTSLEEAIGDKEKQMSMLRWVHKAIFQNTNLIVNHKFLCYSEQRDRAESEKIEERELHEREIAEYKMKLHSFESEVDKLTTRLHRALAEKDRLESKLECSMSELGRSKAELDKSVDLGRGGRDRDRDRDRDNWDTANQKLQRLEIENDRLRGELERSQVGVRWTLIDILQSLMFGFVHRRHLGATLLRHPKNWTVFKNVPTRQLQNFVEHKPSYELLKLVFN